MKCSNLDYILDAEPWPDFELMMANDPKTKTTRSYCAVEYIGTITRPDGSIARLYVGERKQDAFENG